MTDFLTDGSFWGAMGVLATILVFFAGLVVSALRWMYQNMQVEQEKRLDTQFESLESKIDERQAAISDNEKEIAKLRAEHGEQIAERKERIAELKGHMAEQYIHRKDWIRMEGSRDIAIRHIRQDLKTLSESVAALVAKQESV